MSDDLDDILGTELDDPELERTARMLAHRRPVPSPAFRGGLGRMLRTTPVLGPVRHLRLKALGLAIGGLLLLALAGAGVAGGGPLTASHEAAAPASSAAASH